MACRKCALPAFHNLMVPSLAWELLLILKRPQNNTKMENCAAHYIFSNYLSNFPEWEKNKSSVFEFIKMRDGSCYPRDMNGYEDLLSV